MEFRVVKNEYMDRVDILVGELDYRTGKIGRVAEYVEFEMVDRGPGSLISRATIELDSYAAVALMNALWGVGIRPTDFKSPGGEIKRLEDHLADMRKLVFK